MLVRERTWSGIGRQLIKVGTGIAGIVAALAGAKRAVISDYPAPEILATLRANVEENIPSARRESTSVHGHEWGVLTDDFSKANAKRFTRILCADCLWMVGEHFSLVKSMLHFLSDNTSARVLVVGAFHTGRAIPASFFAVAATAGLEAEKIWERDVHGVEREWVAEKDGGREDITERKKWLVVAVLRLSQLNNG